MTLVPVSYKRHRFPPQIIAHAVWLYFRFPLSLRLVEEMLLERGIVVSYETIAVKNALTEDWSNGQTEGQINRLKTLKRAMYGRAN